jgi:YYY domain-containing protein
MLAIVVLLGGYLRFVGLNWDSFSALHPDERFLTLNLLPLVGGGLELTPDDTNFPSQAIYVRSDSPTLFSSLDIQANSLLVVGALDKTVGADYVRWWLGEARLRPYATVDELQNALLDGAISAFLLDAKLPFALSLGAITPKMIETVSSESLQLLRCQTLYPATNGVGGYFDARCSNLNPHNANAGFYAYGTLPLFIAHGMVEFLQNMQSVAPQIFSFEGHALAWRFWSAFFDVGTIIVVYFIGCRAHNRWTGVLATLLYACAPLAIQKAHFGTVNAITAFFVALAIWAAVSVQIRGRYYYYAMFGFAFGCALAGRINILPLFGVLGLAYLVQLAPTLDSQVSGRERSRILMWHTGGMVFASVIAILVFRIANPYALVGPNFISLAINSRFTGDLASAQFGISGMSDAPPNYQWVGRGDYLYPLKDIVLWGMGIASSGMMLFGLGWASLRIIRRQPLSTLNLLLVVWVLVYFGYMGRQWVMTMRYYLPLYSAFVLLAAWAVVELVRLSYTHKVPITRVLLAFFGSILALIPIFYVVNGFALTTTALVALVVAVGLFISAVLPAKQRSVILTGFVAIFSVVWALMFTNIYRQELTRVQASRWQLENIPSDFSMVIEGAPQGTSIINIALPNGSGNSALKPADLLFSATRYRLNVPYLYEFTAPSDGTISQIFVPHLGDMSDDPTAEILYTSISRYNSFGDLELLTEQVLTADFSRANHILGDSYVIALATPLQVTKGEKYTFKAEAINGEFIGAGSVMLTEGDWDDRLTTVMVCTLPDGMTQNDNPAPGLLPYRDCNGTTSAYNYVQSYDMAMSYPIDDDLKRDSIRDALQVGDYLAITSNRFYDSEARNLVRFPLTTRYYEALFKQELGYELVGLFADSYEFMGLSVSDQHLPIFQSPMWFNEFESDEAFHVYDHPVTFIYKKTGAYDQAQVDDLLNSYPLNRVETIPFDAEIGSEIVGAIYWDSLQITAAPNALMLAPDQKVINQTGGTWAERFDSDSLLNTNQVVGVLVWWIALCVFGWVAFPILYTIFPRMTDRGYGFAKLLGMFLVSYLAWFFAGLKVPLWSQAGIVIALLAVLGLSVFLVRQRGAELRDYVRSHWKLLLTIETLTFILFLVGIGLRLTNPDLWHQYKGGEKPMDFAYFNAVLRTTTFPISDPWFGGGYINYYYWGYVLVGSPILLLKIVPSFAYNLAIPTFFALTGMGAFSVAFNVVASWREREISHDTLRVSRRQWGNPYLAGIGALMLCVVLGNLDTIRVLGNGIAQLGGYRTPIGMTAWLQEQVMPITEQDMLNLQNRILANSLSDRIAYEVYNSVSLISGFTQGLGLALQGVPLPIGTDRWYWGPSRVLGETPGVEGNAITEMPAFTFIYGDLHAHMLNMPILLFVMLFIFSELLNAKHDDRTFFALLLSVVIGGAVTGMIQAINTWDLPAFVIFAVIGLGYAWWVRYQTFSRKSFTFMFFFIGGFLVASFGASLPYRTWYAATYGSVQLWDAGKTPFWAYFDIWGLFLFLIVSLLVWETGRWLRAIKVKDLRGWGNLVLIALITSILLLIFLVGVAAINYQVALIVVPLIVWIGCLFFRQGQSLAMQYVLVITGLALALTLGVEVIVLGGDIGRQNTVFKFYIQAWILLSVAGGCAFAWVIRASETWGNKLTFAWYIPLMVLVFIAMMYPIMATRGRSYDRISWETPLTLNGTDYMPYATHDLFYTTGQISLKDDYSIIRWMQENVVGTPIIMEGREIASEYTWTARVAINTGLPSVLGWRFHQTQQRTFVPLSQVIDGRENNIKFFYNTTNIRNASEILRFYDVQYVIVSGLERRVYSPEGIAKFDNMVTMGLLELVHEEGEGRIYRVHQDEIVAYMKNTQE